MVPLSEKTEFATYQHKDMRQTWYVQYRDNWTLRVGPVTWEIFKADFLDRFLPKAMREAKSDAVHQSSPRREECP